MIIGNDGRLSVIVRSYNPTVSCVEAPQYLDQGKCLDVLDMMYTSNDRRNFTRQVGPGPSNRALIPDGGKTFNEREFSAQRHTRSRHG